MDVPRPMEQACQIPSQLLGGRAGTRKVHTRLYPALVNVRRSEGSWEWSFITSWKCAYPTPRKKYAISLSPFPLRPCFSQWLPILACASTTSRPTYTPQRPSGNRAASQAVREARAVSFHARLQSAGSQRTAVSSPWAPRTRCGAVVCSNSPTKLPLPSALLLKSSFPNFVHKAVTTRWREHTFKEITKKLQLI